MKPELTVLKPLRMQEQQAAYWEKGKEEILDLWTLRLVCPIPSYLFYFCMWVWRTDTDIPCLLWVLSTLFTEPGSLPGPRAGDLSKLASQLLWGLPVSDSWALGLQARPPCPLGFLCAAEDVNSGPHPCCTNALPTKAIFPRSPY